MGLRRHPALAVSIVTLLAAMGVACSSVLGLDPPSLNPCATTGCMDASVPSVTDTGAPSTMDSTAPPPPRDASPGMDVTVVTPMPEASVPDVIPDRGPSDGIRCGIGASEFFCEPGGECCLQFDDAGNQEYSCVSSASACDDKGGYGIACATNNDCYGSDVCCFYTSGIKCEPENTSSCTMLVCDPAGSTDQCSPAKCDVAYLFPGTGIEIPYDGCSQ